MLTYDVETAAGHENCLRLVIKEKEFGFSSPSISSLGSVSNVEESYSIPSSPIHPKCLIMDVKKAEIKIDWIAQKGGMVLIDTYPEVEVHGLKHDGRLFRSRRIFLIRSTQIRRLGNHIPGVIVSLASILGSRASNPL